MSLPPPNQNKTVKSVPETLNSCLQLGPLNSFEEIKKAHRLRCPATSVAGAVVTATTTLPPLLPQQSDHSTAPQRPRYVAIVPRTDKHIEHLMTQPTPGNDPVRPSGMNIEGVPGLSRRDAIDLSTPPHEEETHNSASRIKWERSDKLKLMEIVSRVTGLDRKFPSRRLPWDQIFAEFNDGRRTYRTLTAIEWQYRNLYEKGESVASLSQPY